MWAVNFSGRIEGKVRSQLRLISDSADPGRIVAFLSWLDSSLIVELHLLYLIGPFTLQLHICHGWEVMISVAPPLTALFVVVYQL